MFLYSHSLGSLAPVRGWPRQFRNRAQYRAGWMIWFAGLKTIGQKSGSISRTGSLLSPLRTQKRGSNCDFTQSSSRFIVVTPMDVLVPITSLSSPALTTLHSHGMFRRAKNRTLGPNVRWASKWTRPCAKIVPTTVRRGLMYGRTFSNMSFVAFTGPVQSTMWDRGISSAGSSDTRWMQPTWTPPPGNLTLGRLFCQIWGWLVSTCVRTRPPVFPSKRAAQTCPLLPDAIRVTTISSGSLLLTAPGQTWLATWLSRCMPRFRRASGRRSCPSKVSAPS
mmetsp:Transcript_41344/g.128510  ORF Transcript_41344/g.128510 Transcript_41344/m.128510 type:complete len:278 (+) Transcript_41344:775-1608(+)